MVDSAIKTPPTNRGGGNNSRHARRASFHTRRRSQHSIASFGDIADDVIAAPALGSLSEDKKDDNLFENQPGKIKPKAGGAKRHGRKPSNVHVLFGEDDEDEALKNVMALNLAGLMEEEEISDRDDSHNMSEYSPTALHLDDASPSPRNKTNYETYEESKPKQPPKNNRRNQSFGGIVDLFDEDELEGNTNQTARIKELEEENGRLQQELGNSERSRQELKTELEKLRRIISTNEAVRELEFVKSSKIALIISTGKEIDRLRRIIDSAAIQ